MVSADNAEAQCRSPLGCALGAPNLAPGVRPVSGVLSGVPGGVHGGVRGDVQSGAAATATQDTESGAEVERLGQRVLALSIRNRFDRALRLRPPADGSVGRQNNDNDGEAAQHERPPRRQGPVARGRCR